MHLVQFIHPGGEHETNDDVIAWNTGPHKRKFLKNRGRLICGKDVWDTEIGFWGEWEPESAVVDRIPDAAPGYPHFIYSPFYRLPTGNGGQQNTDPFVFGDRFLYSCCQQNTVAGGATAMQDLQAGSVLLFGSCLSKSQFILDTVCVIDHAQPYTPSTITTLFGGVSQAFVDATLSRLPFNLARFGASAPLCLYSGVTWEQHCTPMQGHHHMFSFIPCKPFDKAPHGFARPVISLPGYITDSLTQGRKLSQLPTLTDIVALWESVRDQVVSQGLCLGIWTESPPKMDGSAPRGSGVDWRKPRGC